MRRYPPSVFWGSKPAFRAWWGCGRRPIAAISAGIACGVAACGVAACGGSSSPVPPASIATKLAAGLAALRQHDYWGAEQLFLQVIKRDPSQAAAYYDLGLAYQDRHDYRDALRAYAKAQALDGNFVPVIFNRAVLYSRSDPQLAMFLYRRAIALQHDSPTAFLNLGLLEAGQGPRMHRQAEKDLAEAIRLDPSLASRIPSSLRSDLPAANRSAPSKAR